MLVQALQILAKKGYNIALVLVGSKWYGQNKVTPYVAYVHALAKRSAAPIITTDFVHPSKIPHWYWVGDIFVCPSVWQEPLARVLYEAMATGLPVITTKRGGNPEVISDKGLLVESAEDPASLSESIETLLNDEALCRRLGENGRAYAEKNSGWSRVAHEILEVWGR